MGRWGNGVREPVTSLSPPPTPQSPNTPIPLKSPNPLRTQDSYVELTLKRVRQPPRIPALEDSRNFTIRQIKFKGGKILFSRIFTLFFICCVLLASISGDQASAVVNEHIEFPFFEVVDKDGNLPSESDTLLFERVEGNHGTCCGRVRHRYQQSQSSPVSGSGRFSDRSLRPVEGA